MTDLFSGTADVIHRVHTARAGTAGPELQVQMVASGAASGAHVTNDLTLVHRGTCGNGTGGHVAIDCHSSSEDDGTFWVLQAQHAHGAQTDLQAKHPYT